MPTPPQPVRSRSSERVLDYLKAEFERPDMKQGSRLPTIQQIATHLKVSVPTVHGVFKKLAREGRIRSRAGQGSFLVARSVMRTVHQIALTLDYPKDASNASFPSRLFGGVFRAAADCDPSFVLVPLKNLNDPQRIRAELLEKIPGVDGVLLFPQPFVDEIRSAYEQAGKPVVDYNPPYEMATVNFVSFDYFSECVRLGQALKRSQRRRIVFVLPTRLSESTSARLRRFGLETGLGMGLGDDPALRVLEGNTGQSEEGRRLIRKLIEEEKFIPDAVLCHGDPLALGVLAALQEHGLPVPEDVSVIGGTGLDLSETPCPMLTRVRQPLEELGEAMARMLSRRLQTKGEPVAGRVLPTRFIGGATTLPIENEALGIQSQT